MQHHTVAVPSPFNQQVTLTFNWGYKHSSLAGRLKAWMYNMYRYKKKTCLLFDDQSHAFPPWLAFMLSWASKR